MIAPRLKRFLIAVALAVSIIFYNYVLIVRFEEGKIIDEKKSVLKKLFVKNQQQQVVAFSLMKKLELDGKEYDCRRNLAEKNESSRDEKGSVFAVEIGGGKWMKIRGTQVFVYSVHHDRRLEPYHYLRIIAMIKGGWEWRPLYCQIERGDGQLHTTKITKTAIVAWATTNHSADDRHAYHDPVLLSCRVPFNSAPATLRISTQPCQPSAQKFPINPNRRPENPTNFTACVKPLDFPYDASAKLLQWTTLNKILGAGKFDVYVTDASTPMAANFKLDAVTFRNHSVIEHKDVSFETKIWQRRRYELLIYNDCLYRNIHASRFVVPVDIDEIIVPRLAESWHRLSDLMTGDFASFSVRNAYFFKRDATVKSRSQTDIVGGKVDFFEYYVRSGISPRGHSGKSFVSTRNALLVSNHHALEALRPGVGLVEHLDVGQVQMNHYKDGCDEVLLPECKRYISSGDKVFDNVIDRFKSRFYNEYLEVVKSL